MAAFSIPCQALQEAGAININGAVKAFAAVHSVHVEIVNSVISGTQDLVNPNKSKETFSLMGREMQIVKIGSDRWITVTGEWRKARSSRANPIDSQLDLANSLILKQKDVREGYTVSDDGTTTIGSVSAHNYHLVDKEDSSKHGDVFIGLGQLPLRIVIDPSAGR